MEQKNIRVCLPFNALDPETALHPQVFLRSKGLALSAHRLQCFFFKGLPYRADLMKHCTQKPLCFFLP